MASETREDLCPLCGQPNQCGALAADKCWCCDATIPSDLLELVPLQSQRKACICRACVESYRREPAAFRATLKR